MYITPINTAMPQNKPQFSGKVYSKQTLDKYIELLGEYRKAGNTLENTMQALTESTKTKLEETNNLIRPLIKDDEDFLWTITPGIVKDRFARVVERTNQTTPNSGSAQK